MIDLETLKKIRPGARVRVHETNKSQFEGLVISRKHGSEAGAMFTVRTVLAGVGVEKIFPVHGPTISKVIILSSPKKVHRSKLYFVREKSGAVIRAKIGVSV